MSSPPRIIHGLSNRRLRLPAPVPEVIECQDRKWSAAETFEQAVEPRNRDEALMVQHGQLRSMHQWLHDLYEQGQRTIDKQTPYGVALVRIEDELATLAAGLNALTEMLH